MWGEADLCWNGTAGDGWPVSQQPVSAELPLRVDSAEPRQPRPSPVQGNTCSEEGVPLASHKAAMLGALGCTTSKRGVCQVVQSCCGGEGRPVGWTPEEEGQ